MHFDFDDSIIACSSGLQRCAISIIRISGTNFLEELNSFSKLDLLKLEPKVATFSKISFQNKILDEAVLTYFKGPHSYNGEDILEISVHGNPLNVERIINLIIDNTSIRAAHPGEFTLRAVRNKKMSLNQAEGLDLLLNSNSIFALDQGFSVLSGSLKEQFSELHSNFLYHRSSLELGFDFLEDVGEELFKKKLDESFSLLKKTIENLHSKVINLGFNLIDPEVVLLGEPNAGKSTIFNSLLGHDRSIVSPIKGTTRDFVSEHITHSGNKFKLIDTAGLRLSSDIIETEGVKRSLNLFKNAFFKILVVNPFDIQSFDYKNIDLNQLDLILFTHADLKYFNNAYDTWMESYRDLLAPIEPKKSGPIEPRKSAPIEPRKSGPIEPILDKSIIVDLSNEKKHAIEQVLAAIANKFERVHQFDPIIIERHRQSIKSIYNYFTEYEKIYNAEQDISVVGSELNIMGHCISELIGIVSADDVLHNIFDNFCIGK